MSDIAVPRLNARVFDRIETANILYRVKEARLATLDGKIRKSIDRKCKSHQRKYSAAWRRAMAEYTSLRTKTMNATKKLVSAK